MQLSISITDGERQTDRRGETGREGWRGSGDTVAFTFAAIEVVQNQALLTA